MDPKWLDWARRLQALAQNGLEWADDPFDAERYEAVRGIAAEILSAHSQMKHADALELFRSETGYATPKLDVRGVVFRGDGILLVRERSDGRWTLPGGWADVGETAGEAVVREILEESGYRTRAVKLLALYDRSRHGHPPIEHYAYKAMFHCEILGGRPETSIETSEVGFFPEDDLPELSLGRVTPAQIARFFAHRRHPDWPTDFD